MKRPSVDASLKPLKPFQRRTVEHAFRRLFTAQGGTGRFLVADEVGLGKTLARRWSRGASSLAPSSTSGTT